MAKQQIFNLDLLETKDYTNLGISTKNIHELTYTLLAGSAVCIRLKIQRTAYRLLSSADNPSATSLVLIHKSDTIASNQLAAPYSIIATFGQKVTLKRQNLGIYTLNNCILPQLPQALQLYIYIHPSSIYFDVVKDILSKEVFIVSTRRQQIYVNFSWFRAKQFLKGYGSDALMQYRRLIAECDNQKYTNYLKINLKGVVENENAQKFNSCLFYPGKSKLVLQKAEHYDLNEITKIISLPKLYKEILTQPPYSKLYKSIANLIQDKPDKKMILLKTLKGVGLSSFLHQISQDLEYCFVKIDCKYFVSEAQLLQKIKYSESFSSTVIYIKNIEWLLSLGNDKNDEQEKMKRIIRALEESFFSFGDRGLTSHILIIGFQGNSIKFDMTKNANLLFFEISKQERMDIFSKVTRCCKEFQQIELVDPEQTVKLAANSLGWVTFSNILRNLKKKIKKEEKIETDQVLKQIGKIVSMEKVENIKNVSWDDVGGLENAKQEIIQTILLPTKHPEIFDEWIKPRTGLLFFGPPGTGKTLLGKCIANECKMGFISVKGPELLNMYIGESQKNVREIFERAAASSPCIVFMDQLDALIPKRGQSSDSNQVMDRILSELLTQMDKAPSKGIFIIGATNRPDLLDPAILRPGRFDKQIYLGITKEKEARIQILKAQTRHLHLVQGFDYEKVIEAVPQNFTGADFYGLTTRSITKAAERFIQEYERKQKSEKDEVRICQDDFIVTAKQMKPSVSLQELARYEKLRQQYK